MNIESDWIIAISSALTTIISAGVLGVAYFQIKQVRDQIKGVSQNQKNSILMSVLELESELNKRKENFDKANFDLRTYNHEIESREKQLNKGMFEIYSDRINAARENYLNALDRVSYCILHDYLPDKAWQAEYKDVISEAIDKYEECFGVSSRYRSTKKLYNKWKDEK